MNARDVQDRIRAYLADNTRNYGADTDPEASLLEGGLLDSMEIMMLVGFIEDEYDVFLEEEDFVEDNFRSLGSLAELILSRR
jgi:acyl carrier protein